MAIETHAGMRDDASVGRRRLLRRVLLGVIGVLYVASIPWYRSPDAAPGLLFGLPDWVGFALACYVAVACLNAWAWSLTDVPDEPPDEEQGS